METKKMYDRLNEKLSFVSKPLSKCFMLVLNLSAIIAAIVAVVDYFNPDPFEKLSKQLLDYQDEVASLKMVEIPDSLMTDEIRDIRSNQQKVLANAIMINSFSPINVKDKDINVVKKERDKIIGELEAKIKDILPQYLINETYYLASGYFYVTIREYVIRAFSKKGLIKPNNTGKRFNFNAYAWTLEK